MDENENNNFSDDLIKILTKSIENKIYGSVEVYFEEGKITQVTQRIISKIYHTGLKSSSNSIYRKTTARNFKKVIKTNTLE